MIIIIMEILSIRFLHSYMCGRYKVTCHVNRLMTQAARRNIRIYGTEHAQFVDVVYSIYNRRSEYF